MVGFLLVSGKIPTKGKPYHVLVWLPFYTKVKRVDLKEHKPIIQAGGTNRRAACSYLGPNWASETWPYLAVKCIAFGVPPKQIHLYIFDLSGRIFNLSPLTLSTSRVIVRICHKAWCGQPRIAPRVKPGTDLNNKLPQLFAAAVCTSLWCWQASATRWPTQAGVSDPKTK